MWSEFCLYHFSIAELGENSSGFSKYSLHFSSAKISLMWAYESGFLTELATNFAGMGCGMTDTGGPGAAG
jgi:hypothetical protein